MIRTSLFALAVAVSLSSEAHASGDFGIVAAGCVPDPSSTAYTITNGTVKFSGASVGTIILWCPITFALDPPTVLEVQGVDDSVNGYVQIQYYKINASTGAKTLVASVSTADYFSTPQYATASFSDVYNPGIYRYVLKVVITRSAAVGLTFYGASVY